MHPETKRAPRRRVVKWRWHWNWYAELVCGHLFDLDVDEEPPFGKHARRTCRECAREASR